MVRLSEIDEPLRSRFAELDCPTFDTRPWVTGPPLEERRVAIISTAGLHRRGDRLFSHSAADYRVIPGEIGADDLVMSHVSTNFDRTGFAQDLNVVFPIDRLREMASEGVIGGVAQFHYSVMGATHPGEMESTVRHLAGMLKKDRVDAVLLVPV